MPKTKKDHSLSPGQSGTPEATSPQNNAAEAAASKDAAGPECQIAPAASDSPEATATSPATHDGCGNPDLPGNATDANPSPAEHASAVPTSPQNGNAEAAASKDAADPESQVAPAASDGPEAKATSPTRQVGNPDLPENATDANPSLADPATAVPTSPEDHKSEAGATKGDAGAESQAPTAPSNTPENNPRRPPRNTRNKPLGSMTADVLNHLFPMSRRPPHPSRPLNPSKVSLQT